MTKGKKATAGIFATLFAIIGVFLLFWFFGDNYNDFYNRAQAEFDISGLKDGFIPQGLCYEESSDTFLMSGYMKDGSASRVYVIDAQSGETEKYFTLKNGEEDYVGHAGGIETDGLNVWVVGDGYVFRFAFGEIETVECKGTINIIDSFESGNGADYVVKHENFLIVGEFHKDGKYDTDESHHIGDNKAVALAYLISPFGRCGLTETPVCAISTRSLVQGMEIHNDKIILSTSYSLPKSKIYIYEKPESSIGEFEINEKKIPLFSLTDEILLDTIEAPCMSEEVTVADDKIFILFESACEKYNLVTREQLKHVYSFELEELSPTFKTI